MLSLIIKIAIINIGVSAPIFFLFRWLLSKLNLSERLKYYLSLAGSVIAPWIVVIVLIVGLMIALIYYPKRDFNQAQWLNSPGTRYELADDIVERKMLIGKTKAEVKQLLGNEEGDDDDYGGWRQPNLESRDDWEYYIGHKPAPMRIDASFLEIEFKDDKAVEAHTASQ